MMQSIFFDTSDSLLRVVASVPLIYLAVIVFVRFSGKRATSKMNSFDWVVTVAIGSLVASGIILKDVHLVEVLLAMGMLFALQYALTLGVKKSQFISRIVKSEPVLLFYNSRMLPEAMKQERITEEEIMAAIRGKGVGAFSSVLAVTLESDATLSIMLRNASADIDMSVYRDVEGWPCDSDEPQPADVSSSLVENLSSR